MRGWYAFDEGGKSGQGGWKHYKTNWNPGVAMPHGWAVAEMWLLIRDCIAFEDGDRIVLLAGVPGKWFADRVRVRDMPTHFGPLGFTYAGDAGGGTLELTGRAAPPGGFTLRTPREWDVTCPASDFVVSGVWLS